NGLHGVEVKEGGCPTVRRCTVRGCRSHGLYVHTGGGGTFEDCELSGNARTGARIEAGRPELLRCRIHRNEGPAVAGGPGGAPEGAPVNTPARAPAPGQPWRSCGRGRPARGTTRAGSPARRPGRPRRPGRVARAGRPPTRHRAAPLRESPPAGPRRRAR